MNLANYQSILLMREDQTCMTLLENIPTFSHVVLNDIDDADFTAGVPRNDDTVTEHKKLGTLLKPPRLPLHQASLETFR